MKKIALFSTALIFSFAVMAQTTDTKQPAATKVARNLSSKTKPTETAPSKVESVPLKEVKTTEATQPTQTGPSPDDVIKVNTVEHNFGKIKQGVPVSYSFEIKNISDKPVVVENTYASCGCTTPDKITEPILPGATAKLKVQYNAAAVGPINKDVHIKLAGIAQEKLVKITGEVLAPEPPKESKPNN